MTAAVTSPVRDDTYQLGGLAGVFEARHVVLQPVEEAHCLVWAILICQLPREGLCTLVAVLVIVEEVLQRGACCNQMGYACVVPVEQCATMALTSHLFSCVW